MAVSDHHYTSVWNLQNNANQSQSKGHLKLS